MRIRDHAAIFLVLTAGLVSLKSYACAGVIVRGGQTIDVVFPSEQAALTKALRRMNGRKEFKNVGGWKLEQFVELSDRFASSVLGGEPLNFDLPGFFESAANDEDAARIKSAFDLALDRQLQGISYRGLTHDATFHAIENAGELFVTTHMKPDMQIEFAQYINARDHLRQLPMLGFLSVHETATPPLLNLLQLPIISDGGDLPRRRELRLPELSHSRKFHFAGGYLDSCLLQSLVGIFQSSLKYSQFANIDFDLHADQIYTSDERMLSSYWKAPLRDRANWEEEREEALDAFAEFEFELRELVKLTDVELVVANKDVRNEFLLRQTKTKRTATIRFVSEYKIK